MILADKIIINRKKLNLTQEKLAEELNVSRQAVSKWESAQSIPTMEKIILLSDLFGVSVDYLIRDDIDEIEYFDSEEFSTTRQLSLKEANSFLEKNKKYSTYIGLGIMLCIVSPITLLLLMSLSDLKLITITENTAISIGITVILILVSIAVGIFIAMDSFMEKFGFLEKEPFDLDFGVEGIVKQKQSERRIKNTMSIISGVTLLILSVVPIIISNNLVSKVFAEAYAVPIFLFIVSIAVYILSKNSILENGYSKLLQEKDYSLEKKENSKYYEKIGTVYWLFITTIFLAYSFITNAWVSSWIIWPIAGVLFPLILLIASLFIKDD